MAQKTLVAAEAAPDLGIPASTSTVKVSCIDSTSKIVIPVADFLEPEYKGFSQMAIPAFGFLIEHHSKKVMFDLGVRKDWENLTPSIVAGIKKRGWTTTVEHNVADILTTHDVDVSAGAISEVIWSHHHWDHIGDISTFPHSTTLVVGPGFRDAFLPGYPEKEDAPLHTSDLTSRPLREIAMDSSLQIGRFSAMDYFGDGSFYLLDTPGHSIGHMCGLARTTPDTFIFMGGDACHHGGEFRPSPWLPLPKEVSPFPSTRGVCPGDVLQQLHHKHSATQPFFDALPSMAVDLEKCNWTIEGLEQFDAHDRVFVLIAHDGSVLEDMTFFPKKMNDWHERGLAKKVKWRFLNDFKDCIDGK